VEQTTVRPVGANDQGLANAIRRHLAQLRYEPARFAGAKVRQVVLFARAVSEAVRVDPEDEKTGAPTMRVSAECP
jgi:hypothetical protein